MKWTLPYKLLSREVGNAKVLSLSCPQPNSSLLILDAQKHSDCRPGVSLAHISPTDNTTATAPVSPRYLDLGRIQARSLLDYVSHDDLWGGVIKLYASGCGLETLDGLWRLTSCKYLYLDGNQLPKSELLRILDEFPHGKLISLDLSDNPGDDAELETILLGSDTLLQCAYYNNRTVPRIDS